MTKEELEAVYKAKILPENKAPYHFEKREGATEILAYNSLCGDKFRLYLNEQENTIKEIHFHGMGCAVSKASTSILLKSVEGKSEEEVAQLCERFLMAVTDGDAKPLEEEELQVLAELKNFEGRVDCVKLSWEALLNYLRTKK